MNKNSLSQTLTGVLVVAVGVGLLLSSLHIINFGDFFQVWWPLGLVFVALFALINNPRAWAWPLAIALFGGALILRNFGIITLNLWTLIWPTIVIFVGLSLIFKREEWGRPKDASEDALNASAIFGGQTLRSVSHKFKGGDISAVFGGVELDLRDARIDGTARMNIFAAFGGVEIKVPQGWHVQVTGMPILGGWENKTRMPADKNAPLLKINGTCLCGGVSIKD